MSREESPRKLSMTELIGEMNQAAENGRDDPNAKKKPHPGKDPKPDNPHPCGNGNGG
ncbi:MAG TPA: hypothetical protein PLS90_12560 [Candidatus Sumerlaeota bacterium]|nr:MAG: hypothetical protein BWZ08_00095 [candidate division BRC1 bacterium ADurb.BinA292]HOE95998.1 hypothetical protein [Candidatus Sumerlaeota bacterium]HOR28408.1 hypothetical protein [Candidatus Sumerlaeota bacterium]HPK03277.1 hypothetical protein [Candidatus Sumerlaeota bacterium]